MFFQLFTNIVDRTNLNFSGVFTHQKLKNQFLLYSRSRHFYDWAKNFLIWQTGRDSMQQEGGNFLWYLFLKRTITLACIYHMIFLGKLEFFYSI